MDRDDVTLRPVRAEDAAAIQAIYAPIVAETIISFEEEPPSVAEMAARIAATLPAYPYLVAERGGQVVGYAYASQHRARAAYRKSVDVTVYVAESARRAGVGQALYRALLDDLRRRGFHAAFAGIALPNPGSVGLHESVGFTPVGVFREVGFKFGQWRDVGWWQCLLQGPAPDHG
ncbi:MAG: N-acetyltransferase [Hyphomicrobiales bacterium]|nr:N-acetyltransferase [Hyphomicrobiales bacterium]MCP5371317.1 N-acetyltransferase [Hyphomicrobiales bacterium]